MFGGIIRSETQPVTIRHQRMRTSVKVSQMEKISIQNRKGQRIVILLQRESQKGLAFVMHGLSGFKEQPHIEAFAEAFLNEGFSVVRFDTTNTFGESDGNYEDATVTNYYHDLEDVISWASEQSWYTEPFYLVGHSLGGLAVAQYAENYPNRVKGLAPISTVVSGKLSVKTHGKKQMKEWESSGYLVEQSKSKPGIIKRLKWDHMVDRLKYDLLINVSKLVMPVILIVGDEDKRTPAKHQEMLYVCQRVL